ncbi:hypothetical protein D3C84_1068010 [compost metagenome]
MESFISEHTKDSLKQHTYNTIDLVDDIRKQIEEDRQSFTDDKWSEYDQLLGNLLVKLEQLKEEFEDI